MKKTLIVLFLLFTLPTMAETYKSKFGSSVKIDGDSSVHKWKVESKLIGGTIDVNAAALGKPGKLDAKATVFIPVRSLKSGKKRMDEVMHAAMNAPKHSKIEFTLSEITVKAAKGTLSQCDSKGTLKINGKIQPISMPITVSRAAGKLTVKGNTTVKMTDFDIQPPSPKLPSGNIVTKDEVKITFSWVTGK
jgi:polyisoprenoid-binding protein YceI